MPRRTLYVSFVIVLVALTVTGVVVFSVKSEKPAGAGGRGVVGNLACGPSSYATATHGDVVDVPGGARSPGDALVTRFRYDLPKLNVAELQPDGGDGTTYAEYVLRRNDANVGTFQVRFIGDSWHVTSYSMCSEVEASLR